MVVGQEGSGSGSNVVRARHANLSVTPCWAQLAKGDPKATFHHHKKKKEKKRHLEFRQYIFTFEARLNCAISQPLSWCSAWPRREYIAHPNSTPKPSDVTSLVPGVC